MSSWVKVSVADYKRLTGAARQVESGVFANPLGGTAQPVSASEIPNWTVQPDPEDPVNAIAVFLGFVERQGERHCFPTGTNADAPWLPGSDWHDSYTSVNIADAKGDSGTVGFVYWGYTEEAEGGDEAVPFPGVLGVAETVDDLLTVSPSLRRVVFCALLWDSSDPYGYKIQQLCGGTFQGAAFPNRKCDPFWWRWMPESTKMKIGNVSASHDGLTLVGADVELAIEGTKWVYAAVTFDVYTHELQSVSVAAADTLALAQSTTADLAGGTAKLPLYKVSLTDRLFKVEQDYVHAGVSLALGQVMGTLDNSNTTVLASGDRVVTGLTRNPDGSLLQLTTQPLGTIAAPDITITQSDGGSFASGEVLVCSLNVNPVNKHNLLLTIKTVTFPVLSITNAAASGDAVVVVTSLDVTGHAITANRATLDLSAYGKTLSWNSTNKRLELKNGSTVLSYVYFMSWDA